MLVLVWITERFSAETQKGVNAVFSFFLFWNTLFILEFKNYTTYNKQLDSKEEREACITF